MKRGILLHVWVSFIFFPYCFKMNSEQVLNVTNLAKLPSQKEIKAFANIYLNLNWAILV